jgi:hypothetical protein
VKNRRRGVKDGKAARLMVKVVTDVRSIAKLMEITPAILEAFLSWESAGPSSLRGKTTPQVHASFAAWAQEGNMLSDPLARTCITLIRATVIGLPPYRRLSAAADLVQTIEKQFAASAVTPPGWLQQVAAMTGDAGGSRRTS